MKQMKKWKKVLLCCVGGILVLLIALWIIGWTAPVNTFTPYLFTLSRPELNAFRDDLLKGNEWAYACSPMTASFGLAADSGDCVKGLQALTDEVNAGNTVFYQVYSEEERAADPSLNVVGIYVLRSKSAEKRPYVAMLGGGGLWLVNTLWESLPTAASFQEMGYTSFCIRYRTGEKGKDITFEMVADDIAACISFITQHADEFNVETEDYLIGGFSAGGRSTSVWVNETTGYKKYGLPAPAAACLMYGYGYYDDYSWDPLDTYNLPTFSRYCQSDGNQEVFVALQESLNGRGIANDFKEVITAKHGFGLGSGTDAEGWTKEAEALWIEARE